ncbi:MAG: ATP-dependent Clp protease adaptor ClpS [Muribaculaceae bacterium]|nr:ATP-dependent Clp protease adaptor ClpS [Muribaculaceae bacterium]
MEQNKEQSEIRTLDLNREPDMYDVVFLNDDFTPMDFVVDVLRRVFFLNATVATALMLAVHRSGSAVVGTYILDIAQSKQVKAAGMAQRAGYPLRIKLKPHKDNLE